MKVRRNGLVVLVMWGFAVVLLGSVLTSYHQPFNRPNLGVLTLVPDPGQRSWRMLHIISKSCGCSQRVMRHLLARHRLAGITEQVLLVEGEEADLSGTDQLIAKLASEGFPITRIAASSIPQQMGLHGVPMLVVASPENKIAYMGGYGSRGDQDAPVLQKLQAGSSVDALPILGCAVGSHIRQQADPVGLKYRSR